ncbi:acetyltransferase [Lachnospiraceae bacterium KM106-2]|nr:acetyltransferase [Lachnospiraceae bacterium KM106-2]
MIEVRLERPEDYPRFGFVEAKEFGITDRDGYNFPAFMGMELKPGFFHQRKGKYYESSVYEESLHREEVIAFDQHFSQRGAIK